MKIVVLDGYTLNPGDLNWSRFEEFGKLIVYDRTPVDDELQIISKIDDAEIDSPIKLLFLEKLWMLVLLLSS